MIEYECPDCGHKHTWQKVHTQKPRKCDRCQRAIGPAEIEQQLQDREDQERMGRDRWLAQQRRLEAQRAKYVFGTLVVITVGFLACCGFGLLNKNKLSSPQVEEQGVVRRVTRPALPRTGESRNLPRTSEEPPRPVRPEPKDVATLIKMLKDQNEGNRLKAATRLGELGLAAEEAIPALIEALKDKQAPVRAAAAAALGRLGPEAKAAVGPLLELVKTEDSPVRPAAIVALGQIGPEAKPACPVLAAIVKNPQDKNRREAAQALANIGGGGAEVIPLWLALLSNNDEQLAKIAVIAIGKIGPKASEAVPVLILSLKKPKLHEDAAEALVKMGKAAVPELISVLKEEKSKREDRIDAANILGDIGPDAKAAVTDLMVVAETDMYGTVKQAARAALAKIRRKS